MRFYTAFLASSIAGFSTILGGLVIFLNIKNKEKIITLGLSLAAGVMISLSLLELLPESIINILKDNKNIIGIIIILGMFELGYLMVKIANKLIGKSSNTLFKLGILNMVALMLHNFPEGIASFITTYSNPNIGYKIALAIMIHNIPEGLSIAIPIYYSTKSRGKALFLCALSGLSEPLGALLCYILIKNKINIINMNLLFIIIAGLMITLSVTKIIPEAKKHNNKKDLIMGLLLGSIIMIITIFFF